MLSSLRSLTLPVLAASAVVLVPAAPAGAKASHEGWPRINGVLKMDKRDRGLTLRGTRRSDELLGGHRGNRIIGGPASDVLWGDYKPSGQNSWQFDRMAGGDGRDFIYASHGRNRIYGGTGNDVIHAHFGRGRINCGAGNDLVFLSRKRRAGWHLRHCERTTYRTERSG
jgi:hypothetical protein